MSCIPTALEIAKKREKRNGGKNHHSMEQGLLYMQVFQVQFLASPVNKVIRQPRAGKD